MRSTFSVSTWTWALAGCLALFLGCSQGEGDRCETTADCSGDLECSFNGAGSSHDGICRPRGGTGPTTGVPTSTGTQVTPSTGTGTSTETGTGQPDASVAPIGGEDDASADGALSSDGP